MLSGFFGSGNLVSISRSLTHAPLTRNLFCNEREEANEEANRLVPDRHWCLSQRGGQGGKKGLIPSKPVSG
jgi:hypothetical protein